MSVLYLIRHPHPLVNLETPAATWALSEQGIAQTEALLKAPFWSQVNTVYPSREIKAIAPAKEAALAFNIPVIPRSAFGEVDRSAYIAQEQADFEANVAAYFARPDHSANGWETAHSAGERFQRELEQVLTWHDPDQSVAVISHGLILTTVIARLKGEPPTLDFWRGIGYGAVLAVDRATMQPLSGFLAAPYSGLITP